jgi:hypothetical protein
MTTTRASRALANSLTEPAAAAAALWQALRARLDGAFERRDASDVYNTGPLDDRILRDIGATRFGVREAALAERIELAVRRRAA